MSDYITVVSGLARCGSSATMQALVAGGIHPGPIASHPYLEDGRQTTHEAEPGWLHEYIGMAIKWLDPEAWPLPPPDECPPMRFVWLDRNTKEQARSTVKYVQNKSRELALSKGIDVDSIVNSQSVPERMRQLKHTRPIALRRLRARGPVLVTSYESLLERKRVTMQNIDDHLHPRELDIDMMCKVIMPRSAKCSPVMLEDLLVKLGPAPTGSHDSR